MSRTLIRRIAKAALGLTCALAMSAALPGCIVVHERCKMCDRPCCKKKCPEGCQKPCCKKKAAEKNVEEKAEEK